MSSVSCEIVFDNNPLGIFQAGQFLTGRVILTLMKDKKVDGVSLRILGQAHCGWTRRELATDKLKSGRPQTNNIRYHAEEIYCDTVTDLVKNNNGRATCLKSGKHTYSFSCALPITLPCSFEGSHGNIRYTAVVTFRRHLGVDSKYKTIFRIQSAHDLNKDPTYKVPVKSEAFKKFWGGFTGHPLSISTEITRNGFVPGEHVEIRTHIVNNSGVDVIGMRYYLQKVITYHSNTPVTRCLEEKIVVAESTGSGIGAYKRTQLVHNIIVPHDHPPQLDTCSIIDIKYLVKVEARVSAIHRNLKLTLPITLGTKPIDGIYDVNRLEMPAAPPEMEPPPTYEESEGMYRNKNTTKVSKDTSSKSSSFICYYEQDDGK
ncbi:arrestin domain-containing protein 17-like [Ctenocephalides felis]|uniref:arrestin domain-containing protein 17-like n=1 Tax=Ctenocephalides felis TaxID=7515 RepID=UPI000E6E4471|nr:arrestin domain-containing protein 17-like [Ctenocephalides felis]